ncbi:hypothetical protein KKA69_03880 [Patescibacteria group bacterium]|nr:hypothetical protein [Patescibacteria group bacterium]
MSKKKAITDNEGFLTKSEIEEFKKIAEEKIASQPRADSKEERTTANPDHHPSKCCRKTWRMLILKQLKMKHTNVSQKLQKRNKLWMIIVLFLGIFIVGYLLLFTTSQPELKVQPSSGSIRIIGDPANYQKSIGSTGFEKILKIAGSKELCWTPPECEQIVEKKEKEGWTSINLDRLSEAEKKCLFECLPPPDFPWAGERESVTLSLTGNQVTQLIAVRLSGNYKVSDLIVNINAGTLNFQGVSKNPLYPGKITGELLLENHQYRLRSLHIGQVPVPQQMKRSIESNLDSIIIDALAAYGVSLPSIKIENDELIVTVETPKGLVKKDGNNVIINFEILPTPVPTKPEEDIRIQ